MADEAIHSEPHDNQHSQKRNRLLVLLAVSVVIVLLIIGVHWLFWGRFHQSTDDAYIQGNKVPVSARIAGTVINIHIANTDFVEAGDVLIRLDDSNTRLALAQAKAKLAQTLRKTQALYAKTDQLKIKLIQARKDYNRAKRLKKIRGISTRDLQHARTAKEIAKASYKAASARTGNTDIPHNPQVLLAISHLRKAWLNQQRTRIKAPVSGYIAQNSVELGQHVRPGKPLLSIVPLAHLWVVANFKETAIRDLRIGQPVTIKTDLYGSSHLFKGKVAGLAAGTGNAFSLIPPQNATGNWVKIIQRLPVRITLQNNEQGSFPLHIGLSTKVTIDTSDRSGQILADRSAPNGGRRTQVYRQDDKNLKAMVNSIIADNLSN